MEPDEAVLKIGTAVTFVTNVMVCVAGLQAYKKRAKKSILLIAVSAMIGAILAIVWRMPDETFSPNVWTMIELTGYLDLIVWCVGMCILLSEYSEQGNPGA